jgi:hypothetical protein
MTTHGVIVLPELNRGPSRRSLLVLTHGSATSGPV